MKSNPVLRQSGLAKRPLLWMRCIAVLCVALIGIVSTAQVCHTHTSSAALPTQSSANLHQAAELSLDRGTDPAVLCPLCLAMHSALPATHTLTQVAVLSAPSSMQRACTPIRLFLWRADLASRPPPPVASLLA